MRLRLSLASLGLAAAISSLGAQVPAAEYAQRRAALAAKVVGGAITALDGDVDEHNVWTEMRLVLSNGRVLTVGAERAWDGGTELGIEVESAAQPAAPRGQ